MAGRAGRTGIDTKGESVCFSVYSTSSRILLNNQFVICVCRDLCVISFLFLVHSFLFALSVGITISFILICIFFS